MRYRLARPNARLIFASLLLSGCAEHPSSILSPDESPRFVAAAKLSAWSSATPIAELNTRAAEGCPFLSKRGDALYFTTNSDLHVSRWDEAAQRWGAPVNLGAGINTPFNESCSVVLNGEKEMIFYSDRPGGAGGFDLWSATRSDHRDDQGWSAPVNLGALNTSVAEFGHGVYEEEDGTTVLYFNRPVRPVPGKTST